MSSAISVHNLTMQYKGRPAPVGLTGKARRARIDALMEQFGLIGVRASDPAQVSGGQLKRMQMVRALLNPPPYATAFSS